MLKFTNQRKILLIYGIGYNKVLLLRLEIKDLVVLVGHSQLPKIYKVNIG